MYKMDSACENLELTPIQQFYSNTKILITGATGFFGRILLEKLLRSCPDVSTIYILVRHRREKDPETRKKEIVDHVLFQRLKTEQPNFINKIVEVNGDCALPNLGLNPQDMDILKKEVNIIFHLAATVNFMEKLKMATFINIRATRDIITFARGMPNLKVLMHVSTAYSNCILKMIEEKIYPPAFNSNAMIMMAENLPESVLDKISDMLVGEYRYTYTFTKQIAEGICKEDGKNLPIGIHRPAIAISTYKEPVQSWINNLYSVTGLMAYANLGILRTMYGDDCSKSSVIPVDMCMNSLIASAWDTAAAYEQAKLQQQKYEIPVYHYESNSVNPITWGQILEKSFYYYSQSLNFRARWFHYFKLHNNSCVHKLYRLLLHILPAFFLDLIALSLGKSPTMLNMYSKLHKLIDLITHFATTDWTFTSHNVIKMIDKMSDRDREIFFSDLRQLDWNDFFKTYMLGIKLYVLKDTDQNVSKGKWERRFLVQLFISVTVGISLLLIVWYLNTTTF